MPIEIGWQTIAIRIVVTLLAGTLLGVNRSRHGHEAGLRTTLLVTLAASIAMIQMNLLLPTNGKPHDSYAVMDIMRLPLGILTGVGFIGAGAIIKKDDTIVGITTAATLWFSTVIGLCIGGGQIVLGIVATILGFLVLAAFQYFESRLDEMQRATLTVTVGADGISENELRALLLHARMKVRSVSVHFSPAQQCTRFQCEVRWPSRKTSMENPPVLRELSLLPGLIEMDWEPASVLPA